MSIGPPFDTEKSTDKADPPSDWREQSRQLDYEERDIRILFEAERVDRKDGTYYSPAEFGDFDPKPGDPDPDVWPLEDYDPGYPEPVRNLILCSGPYPAPYVAWVTEEYLKARYGSYNPVRQEIDVEHLPIYLRPEGWREGDTVEIVATGEHNPSMSLTDDRVEALRRIANLWNGNEVRGQHLLFDKCPSWADIFRDLDQDELRRLVVDPSIDPEFAAAFGDHDWYERRHSVYTKPQRILRKKVWWAPTQRGRTLITERDDFPDLIGDSLEGLRHRVTVGLTALSQALADRSVATYQNPGRLFWCPVSNRYNVDVLSWTNEDPDSAYVIEIITGHHNYELHRETYRKLEYFSENGFIPFAVFDSRETAYKVMNYWYRQGYGELPLGTFNLDTRIDWGQKKIKEAYRDDTTDWALANWSTTSERWRKTLGPEGPDDLQRSDILSLNW